MIELYILCSAIIAALSYITLYLPAVNKAESDILNDNNLLLRSPTTAGVTFLALAFILSPVFILVLARPVLADIFIYRLYVECIQES